MKYLHAKQYEGADKNPHIQFRVKQHVENNCLKCEKFCGKEHDFKECNLKLFGNSRTCDAEFEYTPHKEKLLEFESEV